MLLRKDNENENENGKAWELPNVPKQRLQQNGKCPSPIKPDVSVLLRLRQSQCRNRLGRRTGRCAVSPCFLYPVVYDV